MLHLKKFQTTLILAFEENSALSSENETKIVKIAHSARARETKSSSQLNSRQNFYMEDRKSCLKNGSVYILGILAMFFFKSEGKGFLNS